FESSSVFLDVDVMPPGVDFRSYLNDEVAKCDVFLALVGPSWLTESTDGRRRLDDPDDFVRIEIEAALKRQIPLVPVLVQTATMPRALELPVEMQPLAFRNAVLVDAGRNFSSDVDRLVADVKRLLISGRLSVDDANDLISAAPAESLKAFREYFLCCRIHDMP